MVAAKDGNFSVKIAENEYLCTPTGGAYLKSCTVSSTMGPGVKVSTAKYGV